MQQLGMNAWVNKLLLRYIGMLYYPTHALAAIENALHVYLENCQLCLKSPAVVVNLRTSMTLYHNTVYTEMNSSVVCTEITLNGYRETCGHCSQYVYYNYPDYAFPCR